MFPKALMFPKAEWGASHLCGQARNWSFEAGGRRQEAEGKRKKEGATRRKEPEEVFLQI
ncbi:MULTISPECIES: hypothetical protein [unclassified Microcoleus]|uniref:hypothetical protein n=2 Tax=unclassified Microcoleus TaxID=2642155 RepID=UPI002FD63BD4